MMFQGQSLISCVWGVVQPAANATRPANASEPRVGPRNLSETRLKRLLRRFVPNQRTSNHT